MKKSPLQIDEDTELTEELVAEGFANVSVHADYLAEFSSRIVAAAVAAHPDWSVGERPGEYVCNREGAEITEIARLQEWYELNYRDDVAVMAEEVRQVVHEKHGFAAPALDTPLFARRRIDK